MDISFTTDINVFVSVGIWMSSACRARKRLVLSGTPIQNDLEELFALLQFVLPPSALGAISMTNASSVLLMMGCSGWNVL